MANKFYNIRFFVFVITILITASILFIAIKKYPYLVPFYWKLEYNKLECGGENFSNDALDKLNQIRATIKKRFIIVSGYRNPEKNKKVGGVVNIMHTQGLALDVRVPINYREEFYIAAKNAGFTAFGWGPTTVHIDLGKARWWTYDNNGKTMSGNKKYKYLKFAPSSFKKDINMAILKF